MIASKSRRRLLGLRPLMWLGLMLATTFLVEDFGMYVIIIPLSLYLLWLSIKGFTEKVSEVTINKEKEISYEGVNYPHSKYLYDYREFTMGYPKIAFLTIEEKYTLFIVDKKTEDIVAKIACEYFSLEDREQIVRAVQYNEKKNK